MLNFGYNIVTTVVENASEAVIQTGRPAEHWAGEAYRLYVRVVEAQAIWTHEVLFILRLYEERQWASDWHNFNADLIGFNFKVSQIVKVFANLAHRIGIENWRSNSQVDSLCTEDGNWLEMPAQQYSEWFWQKKSSQHESKRILTEYTDIVGHFSAKKLRLNSTGVFEGLSAITVDFDNLDEFDRYYANVKIRANEFAKINLRLGSSISSHCELRELL